MRHLWRFALVLPVGALCLGVSCAPKANGGYTGKQPATTFAQEKEAAKREGLPLTGKELQRPLPPAEQNAAPLYVQLTQMDKAHHLREEELVVSEGAGRRIPAADKIEAIRRVQASHADILQLVHQAVARPQCVFERDWSNPVLTLFPEFARMRSAVRWLSAESAVLLHDGKPLEAVRNQALGFRIARHAASEPTLIAYLVSVAVDSITLAGMERILYEAGDKIEVAEAVRQAVEKGWKPESLAYAMHGEVVTQISALDMVRKGGATALRNLLVVTDNTAEIEAKLPKTKEGLERFLDENGAILLSVTRKIIHASDQPFPKARPVMQEVTDDLERNKTEPSYLLTNILIPVFEQVVNRRAQIQAKADIVRAAAALLAWKAKHKAFPAKLEEAISPVPADPFDGKPLRYKQEGKGFVVYSIGETGTFDGGDTDTAPKPMESVFRYPLPEWMKKPMPIAR